MKYDFTYVNPTKIYFGKDSLNNLEVELKKYGKNILLVYGLNSIKTNGIYDKVISYLKKGDKNIFELQGVMSNPTYKKMMEGASIVKKHSIDLILAVGGGSVIDCAKGISAAAYCVGDPWIRYWMNGEQVDSKIIPIASILTMVGTGSEMNGGSVITNDEFKIKKSYTFNDEVYPKFSILNPEFTYSVSEYQMVSGIADIVSHLLEQYFSGTDDNVSDYIIEALLKSVIKNAYSAFKNKEDYEARSNLMWASTVALNTLVGLSKEQDWQVHMIEHQLGAYTNCAHGMGLAAISIPYYKHIYKYGLDKFVRFAVETFNISKDMPADKIALEGISSLEKFFKDINVVMSLKELGATNEMLPNIANSTIILEAYTKLSSEDILSILKKAFN
ncbi:MAG: iron-containing alcohol dehydrogenase [Anaeroplasmataceae bacterium]